MAILKKNYSIIATYRISSISDFVSAFEHEDLFLSMFGQSINNWDGTVDDETAINDILKIVDGIWYSEYVDDGRDGFFKISKVEYLNTEDI